MSGNSDEPSDESLLAAFNGGDPKGFETLLARYRTPIFNFVLRSVRSKDRAHDLTQDVFLRVVQRASTFEGKSKFSTWLYTIARNLCIDHARKMGFRRHESLDAPIGGDEGSAPMVDRVRSEAPITDRAAIAEQLQGQIAEAVDGLPEEQREVFVLRQLRGMPFKQIAEIVGVPENTVKSRMRYALERLQAALAEYQDYLAGLNT